MTHRATDRALARTVCLSALALGALAPAACRDAAATGVIVEGAADPTLVGTWTGTIEGRAGAAPLTIRLNADSSMSAAPNNSVECVLYGRWTVSEFEFRGTGRDCTGTSVTLVSPVRGVQLSGTWRASIGTSGTFVVTKQ